VGGAEIDKRHDCAPGDIARPALLRIGPVTQKPRRLNILLQVGIKGSAATKRNSKLDTQLRLVRGSWGQCSMRERDWALRTETLNGHSEATKALALAVVGLMTFMLISNLVLLILY
jgi:hypothetical protein